MEMDRLSTFFDRSEIKGGLTSSSPKEKSTQPSRRVLLHRRQHVGVDPERDLHALVPEPLLNHLHRHAGNL